MKLRPLSDELTVSDQLKPEDMAALAAQGYRAVICNRPDGEEPGQPTMAENKAAAEAAGLAYATLPVAGRPTEAQGDSFAALVETLPKPIVAHCKAGGRSAVLAGMIRR